MIHQYNYVTRAWCGIMMGTFLLTYAATVAGEQNMCVKCDDIQRQFAIAQERTRIYKEAVVLLKKSEEELDRSRNMMETLGNIHIYLESIYIPVSTIIEGYCGPAGKAWGGSVGVIRDLARGNSLPEMTLSAVVAYAGFGTVTDIISLEKFFDEYQQDRDTFATLRKHMAKTKRDFISSIRELEKKAAILQRHMKSGGCEEVGAFDLQRLLNQ